jgi:hypothetical protein
MDVWEYQGAAHITGTTTVAGNFGAIYAHTAATLAAGTTSPNINGEALTGAVIPAGSIFRGWFSAIQLSAGRVTAYRV